MVGVSRGRRCDMCKERRRKCDSKVPTCSLCQRLKCPCVRPGKQFVFVGSRHDLPAGAEGSEALTTYDSSSGLEATHNSKSTRMLLRSDLISISCTPPPCNESTLLARRLACALDDHNASSHSLISTFGNYLEDIPQRIGQYPALDAAVKVAVSGYEAFRRGDQNLSFVVSREYAHALLKLRGSVATFTEEGLPQVIAAVMLLALFETMDGSGRTGWMAHAGGACRLIKSQHFAPRQSELGSKILQSTRGTLILEALMTEESFDSSMQLWHDSVELPEDENALQKESYRYLAMLPDLRKQIKRELEALQSGCLSPTFDVPFRKAQAIATNFQPIYEALLSELDDRIVRKFSDYESCSFVKHPKALRMLQFVFPAMITQLLLHSWISFYDSSAMSVVSMAAQRICHYIPLGMQFRPLGSSHLTMALRMAYIGVSSPTQKVWIRDQINVIHRDVQGNCAHMITFRELDWWADTISLKCLSPTSLPWSLVASEYRNGNLPLFRDWRVKKELEKSMTPRSSNSHGESSDSSGHSATDDIEQTNQAHGKPRSTFTDQPIQIKYAKLC